MNCEGIWKVEITTPYGWERIATAFMRNGDYLAASSTYKNVMVRDVGQNRYDCYKLCFGEPYQLPHFNSGYVRYYYQDINSVLNNWPFMFASPQSNDYYCEWTWALYFHDTYEPTNPFLDIFGFDYLLKPIKFEELLQKMAAAFEKKSTHDKKIRDAKIQELIRYPSKVFDQD